MAPGSACPSSSAVRRAPTTTARTASDPQLDASQRQFGAGTPAAHRAMGVTVRQRQRTGAVPAPRHRAAAGAGQRRDVSAPRDLHERPDARPPARRARCAVPSTAAARCGLPGRVPGRRRCRPGPPPARSVVAHHRAGRDKVMGPPAAHQRVRLGCPGIAADDCGTAQLVCPQHGHLAGMRIRRARLGQVVVTVVPDDDQAEIRDGREYRAAGADHQPGLTAQHLQPARGSAARAPALPTARPPAIRRLLECRRVHGVHISLIGHHDQGTAPGSSRWPPRPRRGAVGPLLTGQGLPHRARAPGPSRIAAEELFAAPVLRPPPTASTPRCASGASSGCGLLLDGGVPRRDRQPQHVGAGTRHNAPRPRRRAGAHRRSAPPRRTPPGPASRVLPT